MSKRLKARQRYRTDLLNRTLLSVENREKSVNFSKEIATRAASPDFISSVLDSLPNPDPVLKALGMDIEVYEDLRYDGRVRAAIRKRKTAVKSMEWSIVGEGVPDEEIDFHKAYISDMKFKFKNVVSEICDSYLLGFKPLEIIWQSDGVRQWPSKLVGKPQRWFSFDDNNELRFLSRENTLHGVELPPNTFIIAQNEPTYENPYGVADLSACYWPVVFRRNGFKFWTTFLEKYGTPFLLGKAPEGTQESKLQDMATVLHDMIQDAVAAIPKDWDAEIMESKSSGGGKDDKHKVYLDTMNTEIAVALLGTNLTTEVQGGSYAAAKTHRDADQTVIESDQEIVEGVINELIQITHDLNFTSRDYPTFRMNQEETVDVMRSERDKNILESNPGFKFTQEYYQRRYNLEDDEFTVTETGEGGGNE